MSKKNKEEKRENQEKLRESLKSDIKANMLKIRECLKNNDLNGVKHFSDLNKHLRGLLK